MKSGTLAGFPSSQVNLTASKRLLHQESIKARLCSLALLLGLITTSGRADTVEVLVVGGGGGGGSTQGGGGGGGGVVSNASYSVTPGTDIIVTVGAGGNGGTSQLGGGTGGNSVFGTITAYGGGGGGGQNNYGPTIGGANGGSGGGSGGSTLYPVNYVGTVGGGGTGSQGGNGGGGYTDGTAPQGSDASGGGGGGAGGAGGGATSGYHPGNGGPGYTSSISGTSTIYGGGGGGSSNGGSSGTGGSGGGGAGASSWAAVGTAGTANRGGGGGGGGINGTGGAGGSGIVVVRYSGSPRATGGTITQASGYTIHTFTGNGTFTINPSGQTDTVDVFAVGGGGSGGDTWGGGGGGGGVKRNTSYPVAMGTPVTVTVGSGGSVGNNGGDSSFGTLIAHGGGRGGNGPGAGNSGGSGGGAGGQGGTAGPGSGTSGEGYAGGYSAGSGIAGAGGGGGAGGVGANAVSDSAGGGGPGYNFNGVLYGGGGGGSGFAAGGAGGSGGGGNGGAVGQSGAAGTANRGGGGGAAAAGSTPGAGGSGVVIVRYSGSPRATGGTITEAGGYTTHAFTSSGTFAWGKYVEVLVVAGGGGGGSITRGGGGGGGGVVYNSSYAALTGTSLTVTVGAGGAAGANGSNSSFGTITAIGGGRGGNYSQSAGQSGGSGGGGINNNYPTGGAGTAGQGSNGGNGADNGTYSLGGGGGGGGGAGGNANTGTVRGGNGGIGYLSSISGTATYYAGGGGGSSDYAAGYAGTGGQGGGGAGGDATAAVSGTANTGGGGGGTAGYGAGAGGSGIVIVRYAGAPVATGGTITQTGGYTIHTFTSSGTFTMLVAQSLPYLAGFESSEGYNTGSATNQGGWFVTQGSADVTTAEYAAGARSLALQSGSTAATALVSFAASATPSVTFLDLYAKPVAASIAANSSLLQTEAAKVGFQIASGQGEVYAYDGVGANQWIAEGYRFALNGSNQASSWQRVTLRLDYTAKKWDLFVNGTLLDYDLAFGSNSETYFRLLTLQGVTAATAYVDGVLAGATNPLFTDADKDGMPDSWESDNGLSTSTDDRNSNLDGDVYTNIEEYFLSTKPNNADVTKPSVPASFTSTSATSTSLGVSWAASSDTGAGTPGIAGYNLYRNGTKVNTTPITGTSYVDSGLTVSTTYTYTVRAVDLAGNLSDPSSTLTLTTPAQASFEVFTPLP